MPPSMAAVMADPPTQILVMIVSAFLSGYSVTLELCYVFRLTTGWLIMASELVYRRCGVMLMAQPLLVSHRSTPPHRPSRRGRS